MNFDLKRPCPKCPFRKDCLKGWLGASRAREIVDSLLRLDQSFPCHETTTFDYEGDYRHTSKEQHCAGAMLFLENQERANQMMRIGERIGIYDRTALDYTIPVFTSAIEMVRHHSERRKKL